MTIEIKRSSMETTIKVVGRLDLVTAPVLGKMIDQNSRNAENIVLELSGLESISDAGIRVLLGANEKIRPTGTFKLIGVGNNVMESLKTSGCADVLAIN